MTPDVLQFLTGEFFGQPIKPRDRPVDGTSARDFGVGDVIDFIREMTEGELFRKMAKQYPFTFHQLLRRHDLHLVQKDGELVASVLQDRSMKTI